MHDILQCPSNLLTNSIELPLVNMENVYYNDDFPVLMHLTNWNWITFRDVAAMRSYLDLSNVVPVQARTVTFIVHIASQGQIQDFVQGGFGILSIVQ